MYDWKGQWIEPDYDDPPGRMRCGKGHVLPRNPASIRVFAPYRQELYTVSYEGAQVNEKDVMEYIWGCKCGATHEIKA